MEIENYLLNKNATILASCYSDVYNCKDTREVDLSKLKEASLWKVFINIVEKYSKEPDWHPKSFIDISFREYGKVNPSFLLRDEVWINYLLTVKKWKENIESTIAKSLIQSYKIIKKWSLNNGYTKSNYERFFNANKEFLIRASHFFYFCSISKSFWDMYKHLNKEERNDVIPLDKIKIIRNMVFKHEELINKMKEKLGDEFV